MTFSFILQLTTKLCLFDIDSSRKRLLEFVGDTSSALPDFPSASLLGGGGANGGAVLTLPRGVDEEDIELFEEAYRNHCEEIVETVVNLQVFLNSRIYFNFF